MNQDQKKARIVGLGSYLPEKILTNQDLEKLVDTSDEWIQSRTGMQQRRIAHPEEFASTMGALAAQNALKSAKKDPTEIDFIIVVTMTPDYVTPATSALIQSEIGATNAAAIDLGAACTGYIYGLSMAKAYIESGLAKNILLIATEKMSSFTDYQDRNTCVLFGDGASAVVISNQGKGLLIDTICLGADGSLAELLYIPAGGSRMPASKTTVDERLHYIKMNGRELFKHAVRRMSGAAKECLEKSNTSDKDLAWVVPHQANIRIVDAVADSLNIPHERIYKTLHKYGNTSAASIAIALDELTQESTLADKERILLVAFGAGLTWGAAILIKV